VVNVKSAVNRLKQRSKLPSGDRIVSIPCVKCRTPLLCWNDDPYLTPYYPYQRICTYCRAAERAEKVAIFGKKS
jgi:hypothetical protein